MIVKVVFYVWDGRDMHAQEMMGGWWEWITGGV